MIRDFTTGATFALAGFRWLLHPRLRMLVIAPLLISLVLFAALIAGTANMLGSAVAWMTAVLPDWLDWLQWLLWPLFGLAAVLLLVYGFTLAVNLLASPFSGLLAQRVQALHGVSPPAPGRTVWAEIVTAPLGEMRKIFYFARIALLFVLLFLLPGLNLLAPFLWAAFGAWMLSVEYCDFPLGNLGIGFPAQRRLLQRRRGLLLGFGSVTMLLTMIPLLNLVIVPAAVIGASLMTMREFPLLSGDAGEDPGEEEGSLASESMPSGGSRPGE